MDQQFLEKIFNNYDHLCGWYLGWFCKDKMNKLQRMIMQTISMYENRKNDLILITTPEKQDKTLELIKHWSPDSTPTRNEVIMKTTYPVKSVKCENICSNY